MAGMTPKQALSKWNAENPSASIAFSEGRGRLSRDAVAKCTELAGKGWSIDGYVIDKGAPATVDSPPVVKKVATVNEKVISDITILYDVNAFEAIDNLGGVWSMREVCNNCRVSLVQCHCGKSTILGDIAVQIRGKR